MFLTRGLFMLFAFIWCANCVYAQVDIPVNTVHVTDDLDSYENLVGGVDYDTDNERNLTVRWNYGDAELVDVHIYIEDINYGLLYYIGRTADGNATSFEWKTDGKYVHPHYKNGPILFASFRFVVVGLITPKKGRIWLYADDTVTLTGPDFKYTCPTNSPTPTPMLKDVPISTPTITATPKPIILNPYGTGLVITDNLHSTDDISKSWDKDHESDRELVIHWNAKWNRSNLILIYVYDQCGSHLLTHIQNNTLHQNSQNWFRWSKDTNVHSPYLQDGPQFDHEYSITVRNYNLKSDSTFSAAYPFLNSSVQFLEGEGIGPTKYPPFRTNTPTVTPTTRLLSYSIQVTEENINSEITVNLPNLPQDAVPLELIWIPPGEVLLGSDIPPQFKDDHHRIRYPKQHAVIENGFFIGRYEITNAQFAQFSSNIRVYNGHNYPVVSSWENAKYFCDWLSKNTPGWTFRLPSEVEWEYACRGGTETRRYWGDDPDNTLICMYENVGDQSIGNFWDCSAHGGWCRDYPAPFDKCNDGYEFLAPVGSFFPNPFGLFDMLGNLYEMCEDDWHWDYENAPLDGSAWVDEPRSTLRVKKGTDYKRHNSILDVNYSERILWIDYAYDGFRIVAEKESESLILPFTSTPTNTPTPTITPTHTPNPNHTLTPTPH